MSAALGKFLILLGVVFILAGMAVFFRVQVPWLGRLPGDIQIKKENFSFYFPFMTCLLLSILLTLLLRFFRR